MKKSLSSPFTALAEVAASLAGSDVVGWIVALAVGAAVAIYQSRSSRATSCPLPQATSRADEPEPTRR